MVGANNINMIIEIGTNDPIIDNEIMRFIRGWNRAKSIFYFDGKTYPTLEQDLIYAFALHNIDSYMIDKLKSYTNQILMIITRKDMVKYGMKWIKTMYDLDFNRWELWVWQKIA